MKTKFIAAGLLLSSFSMIMPSAMAQDDLAAHNRLAMEAKVDGMRLDHKGLPLNPVPQNLIRKDGNVSVVNGFNVVCKNKALNNAMTFVTKNKKGLKLNVSYGEKAAATAGVPAKDEAYVLKITPTAVDIIGYDEAGAFYGLQTLRQILESGASNGGQQLPLLEITDYPELKNRGTVEGFYGNPWSHEVRLSLIDFMGKNKMNSYVYGPKDDPYHRTPSWRQPYPKKEAAKIKELVEASKRNHVNFVWAIHPGGDMRWNQQDYDSLINKFNHMYDLGVRQFAIFFDDISGEGTDSNKQTELLNNVMRDFVNKKGDVGNLIICPTDYNESWANPKPTGQLAIYGNKLMPGIEVFWTGHTVCSNIDRSTMEFVNSRIKRPGLVWWNYPVTDYCKNVILQGPVYGLDQTLTAKDLSGIETNPMEHGEASKLSFYGVADYAWNPKEYNPIDNWERSLEYIVPEVADAYRTFAIHSANPTHWLPRDESWETETFTLDKYTPEKAKALKEEFKRMQQAPAKIRGGIKNQQLLKEIDPWLTQLQALGVRGEKAIDLIGKSKNMGKQEFWKLYQTNLMTADQQKAYDEHSIGITRMQPFYENIMREILAEFLKGMSDADVKALIGEDNFTMLPYILKVKAPTVRALK